MDWIELARERIQGRPHMSMLHKGPGMYGTPEQLSAFLLHGISKKKVNISL
jgi:hypothetical protein